MRCFAPALIAAALAAPALAQPLTTAFTYQGELASAGTPAAGTFDLRFALYDDPGAGSQIGSPLCSDNIAVTDGRFTVQLDFGAVFAGSQRFLEIWVRPDSGLPCSNNTGYTILGPRQPLTAAPNASFALNAANATSASSAANASNLNGQPASFYSNAANLTGTLADARLTPNVTLLAAAQTFTGVKTFSSAPAFTSAGAPFTVSSTTRVDSLNADLLDGLDSSAFLTGIPTPLQLAGSSSGAILRASNAGTGVSVMGIQGEVTSNTISGTSYGGFFTNADDTGIGVFGRTSGPSGQGVYGQATSAANNGAAAVFGQAAALSGANFGGRFTNASTAGAAVRGEATASTGLNYAGLFTNDSASGTAVRGEANAGSGTTYGGFFTSLSPAGTAVRGFQASGSAAGASTRGGWFSSISGTSLTYGVEGRASNSNNGYSIGVNGEADQGGYNVGVWGTGNPNTGASYGVIGATYSPDGAGVSASNYADTGNAVALTASTSSTTGRATLSFATAGTGVNYAGRFENSSTSGRAVFGWTTASTGTTYGVLGQSSSSTGYGLMAFGNSGATGTKSFRIDHPSDPANKYLFHYSAESPEVLNIYSGKVTLDDRGEATVELPPYFAAINKDPRYTLTAIGAPMPMLHVAREVDDSALKLAESSTGPAPLVSFMIAGGAPNAKVSWEVKAVRNDLRLRLHPAPAELDKPDAEKGTFQHPELYNLPQDRGPDGPATPPRTMPRKPYADVLGTPMRE